MFWYELDERGYKVSLRSPNVWKGSKGGKREKAEEEKASERQFRFLG